MQKKKKKRRENKNEHAKCQFEQSTNLHAETRVLQLDGTADSSSMATDASFRLLQNVLRLRSFKVCNQSVDSHYLP